MIFDPILDLFRGRAITIPPLDGALRANTVLDDAAAAALAAADNLVPFRGRIVASSGAALVAVDRAATEVLWHYPAAVTALAAAPDGRLAAGLEDGSLQEGEATVALPEGIGCITALAYGADGALWLSNGSARHPASAWVADLMEKGASGSVWRRDPGAATFRQVAGGLAWPNGLLPQAAGVVVSESWRHRLLRIGAGTPQPVLAHLPGYPARLAPAPDGGAWLCLFAPRTRLIEFVLQETQYRRDMMAEVPRDFWIAPALTSGRSFLEPLQCGSIRSMGVHKAWSPSRSYGLVLRLDADLAPRTSLHSRANGKRHGICSVLEAQGRLWVASKGGDCVLSLDPAAGGQ